MKERPMLFNGDMVRAILAGRKTQTRRPVKIDMANAFDPPRGKEDVSSGYPLFEDGEGTWHKAVDCCPFGQVGDRIWVRETWRIDGVGRTVALAFGETNPELFENLSFFADCEFDPGLKPGPWIPSIHMPRWASRINLEITNIRVERVQDISEDDAMAEGSPWEDCWVSYVQSFESIWDACYSARGLGWDDNPWVWVIDFKMVKVD